MTVAQYRWTIDRYHQAIAAGLFPDQALELLNGELIIMPPEGELHAYCNSEVGDYLRSLLGPLAKVREAHPITLPNDSEPIPNLAIVKPQGRVYLQHHPYPEDIFWLIEFSHSTLEKDLTLKRDIYAAAGISEYWVVNLLERELTVFRQLEQGQYCQATTHKTGFIAPQAWPQLEIAIERLMNP